MRRYRACVSALLGLLAALSASTPAWSPLVLVGALLVGLPHGALDHRIAARQWASWSGLRGQISFHLTYLLLVAVVILLWRLAPAAALLLFLVASALHFSESDLLHLPDRSTAMLLSRGALLIAAPLLAWPADSSALLAPLTGEAPALPAALGPLLALGAAVVHIWLMKRAPVADQQDAIALAVLLIGGGPVLGLGLYFILWHTPEHVLLLSRTFADRPGQLVRSALPRTLGAGLLIAAGAWLVPSESWTVLIVQITAALTIPHALVVHFGLSGGRVQQSAC